MPTMGMAFFVVPSLKKKEKAMNAIVVVKAENFALDSELMSLAGINLTENKWMLRSQDKVRKTATLISIKFEVMLMEPTDALNQSFIDMEFGEDTRKSKALGGRSLWFKHANSRELVERTILDVQGLVPGAVWTGDLIDQASLLGKVTMSKSVLNKAMTALLLCQRPAFHAISGHEMEQCKLNHEETMEVLALARQDHIQSKPNPLKEILGPCHDEIIQMFEGVRA